MNMDEIEFLTLLKDKLTLLSQEIAVNTPVLEMIALIESRILELQKS